MATNFHPEYSAPTYQNPVQKLLTPEITAAQAARGLGDHFPYSGGAMATHKNFGVPKISGGSLSGAGSPHLPSTHSYGMDSGQRPHVVHSPRFIG